MQQWQEHGSQPGTSDVSMHVSARSRGYDMMQEVDGQGGQEACRCPS